MWKNSLKIKFIKKKLNHKSPQSEQKDSLVLVILYSNITAL
jgi:hypothetical protein